MTPAPAGLASLAVTPHTSNTPIEFPILYPDDAAAAWLYTRALVTFRRRHDGPAARKALAKARRGNPHVPAYLTGALKVPRRPDYIGFGDESEAIAYAAEFREAWRTTPGALSWLNHDANTPSRSRRPRR